MHASCHSQQKAATQSAAASLPRERLRSKLEVRHVIQFALKQCKVKAASPPAAAHTAAGAATAAVGHCLAWHTVAITLPGTGCTSGRRPLQLMLLLLCARLVSWLVCRLCGRLLLLRRLEADQHTKVFVQLEAQLAPRH